MSDRDKGALQMIVKYCSDIETGIEQHQVDYHKFLADATIRNGLSMALLQIGENVKKLSRETRQRYNKIPWSMVAGMRDHFAHGYDVMKDDLIWEAAELDAPALKAYCLEILQQTEVTP